MERQKQKYEKLQEHFRTKERSDTERAAAAASRHGSQQEFQEARQLFPRLNNDQKFFTSL